MKLQFARARNALRQTGAAVRQWRESHLLLRVVLEQQVGAVGGGHGSARWDDSGGRARLDEDVGRYDAGAGGEGSEDRGDDFAVVLGGRRVGELLPQVVLGHFAAGDAVKEGLRFGTFEDFRLADVRIDRVVHLVEVEHFVEKFVLLLLMLMEHVDRGMALVVRRRLLLLWGNVRTLVRGRSLLLDVLVLGDLGQQLLERVHVLLLIQVGRHWTAVPLRGRRSNQPWDGRIDGAVVGWATAIIFAAEARLQLFDAVDLANIWGRRTGVAASTAVTNSEQLLQVAVLHLLMLLLMLHRRMSQQRMSMGMSRMMLLLLLLLVKFLLPLGLLLLLVLLLTALEQLEQRV